MEWLTAVPTQANGKPIYSPMETAYLHTDSSGYGRGCDAWQAGSAGVLVHRGRAGNTTAIPEKSSRPSARRSSRSSPTGPAATYSCTRTSSQLVVHILTNVKMSNMTSRSLVMMAELRRLWYLLDSQHYFRLRARYNLSAANVWADFPSRHMDNDDLQLDPVLFAEMDGRFGSPTIDRFASALSAMLPRYNTGWFDPTCEAVDARAAPRDAAWRGENNWCNAPWHLLPARVQKLLHSGAAATVAWWPPAGWARPPALRPRDARARKIKHAIEVVGYANPWADSMRPYMA
eukprot:jgi/Tetstr1/439375/TSEL_027810.t1